MRIAVTASQPSLDAQVDPRFGRCAYYVVVDVDTLDSEALPNPNVLAMGGAGIQSAQLIASRGIEIVVSGNYGPNAVQTLNAVGVRALGGVMGGSVRQAVEQFRRGVLQPVSQPTVGPYFGLDGAPGPGRGMGRGGRRGMGRHGGREASPVASPRGAQGTFGPRPYGPDLTVPPPQPPDTSRSGQSELETLKRQAQIMAEQLNAISDRIKQMQKEKRQREAQGE